MTTDKSAVTRHLNTQIHQNVSKYQSARSSARKSTGFLRQPLDETVGKNERKDFYSHVNGRNRRPTKPPRTLGFNMSDRIRGEILSRTDCLMPDARGNIIAIDPGSAIK